MRFFTSIVLNIFFLAVANAQNISNAEYFFDTDPGVGNGTAIPAFTPADTVDLNISVNATGLPVGYHNLFIRFKDANNKWGIYEGRMFYIMPNSSFTGESNLVNAEYFFDTDPGVGNGTAIPAFTPADTIDLNINADATGLAVGTHNLFIRFKDADNKWGIYEGREFTVANCTLPTADFVIPTNGCTGQAITIVDMSSNVSVGATYAWDIDNDGTIDYTTVGDITNTFTTAGLHEVKLIVSNSQCQDSLTLSINIGEPTAGTDVITACNSYTWIDGNTYTASNNSATWTLTNAVGCDSVVTLNLTINTVDNSVTQTGATLDANAVGATYQWLDCNNNYSQLLGENNQSFTASVNGSYAVQVIENGCTDTSSCYVINNVGLSDLSPDSQIKIYPNPTQQNFTLSFDDLSVQEIEILDIKGKLIYRTPAIKNQMVVDISNYETGLYLLRIKTENGYLVKQLVKE